MENRNIILFDGKVKYVKKEEEMLYNMEELIKYFSKDIVHIDPLIQKLKLSFHNFQVKEIPFSSSNEFYINTLDSLRTILYIEGEKANDYKNWMIKCAFERINEIISPMIIYDRLKTILYKKGVRTDYSFIKAEVELLKKKSNYVSLDQKILEEDINDTQIDTNLINKDNITVIKLPRTEKSTNLL